MAAQCYNKQKHLQSVFSTFQYSELQSVFSTFQYSDCSQSSVRLRFFHHYRSRRTGPQCYSKHQQSPCLCRARLLIKCHSPAAVNQSNTSVGGLPGRRANNRQTEELRVIYRGSLTCQQTTHVISGTDRRGRRNGQVSKQRKEDGFDGKTKKNG